MGSLVLVRHAQASFFESDYDRLSAVGEEQARLLGEHWARLNVAFDAVYTGPRVRHQRTAQLVGEVLRRSGRSCPEPVIMAELDEHAVDRLLRESIPEITRAHPHIAPLAAAYEQAQTRDELQRGFQNLFEAVTHLWCKGSCTITGAQSWPEFRDGVHQALAGMMRDDRSGRRIAVFTSVGPISAAIGSVLQCSDQTALETGWRLRNASLTQVVFNRSRMTLDHFNALPHLPDPRLWTFR